MGRSKAKAAAREQRRRQANAVLWAISSHGRRFFWSTWSGRTAHFVFDDRGRLRFVDDHSGAQIHVNAKYWRHGFTHGGTCRAIVQALADYITHETKVPRHHFGPWGEHHGGDRWGYSPEAMAAVRADIERSGIYSDQGALAGAGDD